MNINIISSVKFKATADQKGYTGECTVTTPDGKTAYARLTGTALSALLAANKEQGGSVRGYSSQQTLKRVVNGQQPGTVVTIVEYYTDVLRFNADLLGAYVDQPQNITLAGNTVKSEDASAYVAGVTVVPSTRVPKAAAPEATAGNEVDLA